MTNKEAIDRLIGLRTTYRIRVEMEDIDALNKAIEALEMQSDGKAIIPEGVLKLRTKDYVVYKVDWLLEHFDSERELLEGASKIKVEKFNKAKFDEYMNLLDDGR